MLNEEEQEQPGIPPTQAVSFDDMFSMSSLPPSQQKEDSAPPPDETGEEGDAEASLPVMFGRRHQSFHQLTQEKKAKEKTEDDDNPDENEDDSFQFFQPQYANDDAAEGDQDESSFGMFSQPQVGAFDTNTDDPSSAGAGVLGMNMDAIGSSILGMPMSILGSVPEVTTAPVKQKNMRLIVRRAYRNKYTDHLYCFDEGRRLIVVPTTVSMGDLKEECSRVLRNHEVLEVLINEQGRTRAIKDIRFLCNLDEIVAVTEGPQDTYPCCGKLLGALNIGRPDHKPLVEVDGLSNTSSIASRAASQVAIVVQRMNSTCPVQEKGSLVSNLLHKLAVAAQTSPTWFTAYLKCVRQ
ncbi:hypothetical protein BSKO_00367 [Bryopsis sp. KO-2023]|nr:hypothetical protein BSKO_00367 [Bryopsis sp. KO-2023]